MRRERTNNTIIFIYSLVAVLLLSFLIIYIYLNREEEVPPLVEHPQVEQYTIDGEVLGVSVEDRLLTIKYAGEEIVVGLLEGSRLVDQRQQEIGLDAFRSGDWVEVEVEFIGTGAVLASQVMLFD